MAHSNCISSHLSLHTDNKPQLSLCLYLFCAQTSELMEESEKQIKISPGLVPSSTRCLTPYHLFANFSIIISLFMLVCLFTCFFLFAPSLWRCRFLANTSLTFIISPHMAAKNLYRLNALFTMFCPLASGLKENCLVLCLLKKVDYVDILKICFLFFFPLEVLTYQSWCLPFQ